MSKTECDHPNLKILDKQLEMDTNVKFSENQPWKNEIWEFMKTEHVSLRFCILLRIVYYSGQIHTRVTKLLGIWKMKFYSQLNRISQSRIRIMSG